MKKPASLVLEPVSPQPKKISKPQTARKRSAHAANGNGVEPKPLNGDIETILPCVDLDLNAMLIALSALKKGDFSVRLPITFTGNAGKVADAFNDVADLLSSTT